MAILKRTSKTTGKAAWQVLIDGRDPVTGGRKRSTVGTYRTKKEAEKAERDALTHRERGTLLDPSKTTIGQLLDSWLATKSGVISDQSIKDYEITIRLHLKPALGAIPTQTLTPERLQRQYQAWRDAGMSARQARGCHMRLSQALDQARGWGLVLRNVCDDVSPPKIGKSKADVWNREEARCFLDTAIADALTPLWHLLLLEGMRRGEALGLRWRDINWERGTAHISQTVKPDNTNRGAPLIQDRTKTAAGARSVRLTADTLTVLKEHRTRWLERRIAAEKWADHDLIVCTSVGTPINPNNVARSFNLLVLRAGLRRIRPHDLRHTHATLLLLAGVPAKVVSERLGHASVGITLDLYSHVLPDMQDLAADAMSMLMRSATGTDH